MRRLCILAVATVVIFSTAMFCVYAEDITATYLVADKNGLFLYAEADSNAETIASVRQGTYLSVTETSGNFGKTTYNGVEGWFLLSMAQIVENTGTGVQSLTVSALPTKTDYYIGETLDLSGLEITAQYKDGKSEKENGYTVYTHRLTEYGKTLVFVYYGGVSTSFSVNVNYLPVKAITITALPEKLSYYTGDKLVTSNLEILVSFSDGRPSVTTSTDFFVYGYDSLTAGTQTLRVYYPAGGTSVCAEYSVVVKEKTLLNLEITKMPDKLNYYTDDLTLDLDGLLLTANYDNGEHISANPDNVSYPPLTLGTNSVVLSYSGMSVSFPVTVIEAVPTGITIAGDFKTEYSVGETVLLSGMIVYLNYNSGNTKQVSDYTISDLGNLHIGDNLITVSWGSFQTTFTLNITVKELTGDVNLDGKITAEDARLILRFSARISTFTDVQEHLADVNLDGSANSADARLVLRFAAGLITSF